MKKLFALLLIITLNVISIAQGDEGYLFTKIDKSAVKLDSNGDLKLRNAVGREINKNEYDLVLINGLADLKYKKNIKVNFDSKQDLILTLNKSEIDTHGNETLVFHFGLYNSAIIVINDLKVFGFFQIGADKYNIEPISEKYYLLTQVDNEKVSKLGIECNYNPSTKKNIISKTTSSANLSTINLLTNYTVNVLVAYTQTALDDIGSVQAMNALIDGAQAQANTSYSDSGINITLNVVQKTLANISESAYYLQDDLNNFIADTQIQSLRSQYGADVCVLLLSDANKDGAGLAAGDASQDDPPFCVLRYDYAVTEKTFAHEIGHLQGAQHQYPGSDPIDFAYGWYYKDANPLNSWRTIMSIMAGGYGDKWGYSIQTRIGRWSDPGNYYSDGHILGTSKANNKLKLNNTASYIASLMSDPTTVSGTISSNTTWSGNVNVAGSVTVSSGATLTISYGTNVYFVNGASLTINGILNATSSYFTSAYTWGGIQFNSGSSGNLQYCTIQYVSNNGIYCYNSSPQINNCTIQNCNTGLYCDYYSSPTLVNNLIQNNDPYGVRCNAYSSPNLTNGYSQGGNVIRSNSNSGLYAAYNCTPNLGSTSSGGNSIYSNTSFAITVVYGCYVYAMHNWWGSYPPPSSLFSSYQSTINYAEALNSNPNYNIISNQDNPIATLPSNLNLSVQADDLNSALDKQRDKKYDEAIPLFLEAFKSTKDALVGKYALIKIEECFTQAGKKDFLEYSKKELKPIIKTADETFVVLLELETHQLVNAGLYKEAMDNLFLIKNKHNLNKEIDKNTIYRIGVFYVQLYGDKQNAQKYFDELKKKYPGDDLVNDIDRWMNATNGVSNNGSYIAVAEAAAETLAPENFGVSVENYPNPFNPTTKISFSIPQKSQIKLKVFDVLGREVASLADGVYEIGKYEVTFDASKLPSGVYFYNITTGSNSISKKMLLVK
jgi:hypothetical protein